MHVSLYLYVCFWQSATLSEYAVDYIRLPFYIYVVRS
jgi:hypothetical protein